MPKRQPDPNDERANSSGRAWLVCVGLSLLTLIAFWGVSGAQFVDWDDPGYVSENPIVQQGLTWNNVVWAFTNPGYESNWHPLTWISHLLDVSMFGVTPRGPHLENVAFHIASALLLFLLWRAMTGAVWRSALVAALFALHPAHVESVAWISERKDVLSTFLGLLTLLAYVRYTRRPGTGRYLAVVGLFALGLAAKPMLCTWPCLMLLLDVWPLRRMATWRSLVIEKVPLLVLSGASAGMTYLAQKWGTAVVSVASFPIGIRVENAIVSYARYLFTLVWPVNLGIYYPAAREGLGPAAAAAALLLLGIAAAVLWFSRGDRKYLAVGWLWFVGTLVPVIGFVQVGGQAMADRYTYFPFIGLFVMIAWGVPELLPVWPARRIVLAGAASVVLIGCAALTVRQVRFWSDSRSLFEHAIAVEPRNPAAHTNLGVLEWDAADASLGMARRATAAGQSDEAERWTRESETKRAAAVDHWNSAVAIEPNYTDAYNNLGHAFAEQGRLDQAADSLLKAVQLQPHSASVRTNLGLIRVQQNRLAEGEQQFQAVLADTPRDIKALRGMALVRINQNQAEGAIGYYLQILAIVPEDVGSLSDVAALRMQQGQTHEAIDQLRRVLQLSPDNEGARMNLASALLSERRFAEALDQYRDVVRRHPESAPALQQLAETLATCSDPTIRRGAEAVQFAERLIRITGDSNPDALVTLAAAYAEAAQFEQAIGVVQHGLGLARSSGDTVGVARLEQWSRQLEQQKSRQEAARR